MYSQSFIIGDLEVGLPCGKEFQHIHKTDSLKEKIKKLKNNIGVICLDGDLSKLNTLSPDIYPLLRITNIEESDILIDFKHFYIHQNYS